MEASTAGGGLLERDAERDLLARRLEDARSGRGSVVLVEAAAGLGKTALLRDLRRHAGAFEDVRLLAATASELEGDFPYGVVRQLLEPVVLGAAPERRAELLSGAAALAGGVLGASPAETGSDVGFATLHGLYWLTAVLAEERPLVLCVDDLHWADVASVRFLEFLARRIDELPALLVAGLRPAEPGAPTEVLDALAETPATTVKTLRALSELAAARLVAERLVDAPAAVVDAAVGATGGNPLLLTELLRTLADHAGPVSAAAVRDALPSSVTRSVQRRLTRLTPEADRLVRALAVVGAPRAGGLAQIAGLDDAAAGSALATLVAAGLCEADPPRFAHPLLRAAVREAMPSDERVALHLRAVEVLRERGEEAETLAVHLLAAPPIRADWAVDVLRASATRALAEGASEAATARLERALETLAPDAPDRDAVRLDLAVAEVRVGAPHALRRVDGLIGSPDPEIAAAALALETILFNADPERGLGTVLDAQAALLPRLSPASAAAQRIRMLDTAAVDTRLGGRWQGLLEDAVAGGDTPPQLVFFQAARDTPGAEVIALAEHVLRARPLDDLATLEASSQFWAVISLPAVDGAAVADAALRDAETAVRRTGSRIGGATTSYIRAIWSLHHGSNATAEAESRSAVALWDALGGDAGTPARISAARALVALNRLDEAEAELGTLQHLEHRLIAGDFHGARGVLHLLAGRHAAAVADFEAVERIAAIYGWHELPYAPTRALQARALAGAGRREEAVDVATTAAQRARDRGIAGAEAEALLSLALVTEGDALDVLAAAVELAAPSPALRIRVLAHAEFGAALRRAGRRTDAREQLAEARDLAERCSALRVLAHATEELVLAGGRPRRTALTGVAALTPSERRVAEHAARGLKNREIAETLFVTRKTVESTLGNVFAKLDVRSRTQLAAVFETEGTPGG